MTLLPATSLADDDLPATPQTNADRQRPHYLPAHTLALSPGGSDDHPVLALSRLPLETGSATNVTEQGDKGLHTLPDQLPAHLRRLTTCELHVSADVVATHHQAILAAVRSVASLRRIVLGTMTFDLDDALDTQLAQLVLVLTSHDTGPPVAR